MMLVSYDAEAGVTYVELSEAPIIGTVSVSDLVMVDLGSHGEPAGVEFAVAPARITGAMLDCLGDRFPMLKPLRETDRWLLTSA